MVISVLKVSARVNRVGYLAKARGVQTCHNESVKYSYEISGVFVATGLVDKGFQHILDKKKEVFYVSKTSNLQGI